MRWDEFYRQYRRWNDRTIGAAMASLEEIGHGEDVADVALYLSDQALRDRLLRMAMRYGAHFSEEAFLRLEGALSGDVYAALATYGGFAWDVTSRGASEGRSRSDGLFSIVDGVDSIANLTDRDIENVRNQFDTLERNLGQTEAEAKRQARQKTLDRTLKNVRAIGRIASLGRKRRRK